MAAARPDAGRRRLDVAARVLAAVLGGYGVTALAVGLLARHLPLERVEAVTAATLSGFAIYAAVALAVFAARSTARAWLWIVAAAAVLGAALWLSITVGGRA